MTNIMSMSIIKNRLLLFLISSYTALILFQWFPFLRVPLIICIFTLFCGFNIDKLKFDYIGIQFFILTLYIVIQTVVLLDTSNILEFSQAFISTILYLIFYFASIRFATKTSKSELKQAKKLLTFLIPLFMISFSSWSDLRIAGIFGNPNITSHALLLMLPFVLLHKSSKKGLLIVFFLASIAFLFLGSRSAVLGYTLAMIGYLLTLARTYKLTLALYILLSIPLSIYAIDIFSFILNIVGSTFSISDSRFFYLGYNGRDIIFDMAIDKFNAGNKWFGAGFNQAKFESVENHILSTHNGFLELLLKLGYIGTTLFCTILLSLMIEAIKIRDIQKKAAVVFSLIVILSLSTNSSTFFVFNFFFYYFLLVFNIGRKTK